MASAGDCLCRLVPLALLVDVTLAVDCDGEAMGLVDDREVPVLFRCVERLAGPLGAKEVTAYHDPVELVPRVLGQRRVEVAGAELHEIELEPIGELPDPLRAEIRGRDYEDPVARAAQDQLLHVQPGHDRLARAWVVGQQEPQPRLPQEAVVDRLELVRQRLDVRYRDRCHLVREGDVDPLRLDAEAELHAGRRRTAARSGARLISMPSSSDSASTCLPGPDGPSK